MQFTGLTDKNGKEIYEGDILKEGRGDSSFIYTVIWRTGSWHVEGIGSTTFLKSIVPDSAVIGNIYENPELLNK